MRKFVFLAAIMAALALTPAYGGAVISYGATFLGVNDEGHLNFGFEPTFGLPYGVFRAGVGDSTSPGCLCEGWGVVATHPVSGSQAIFFNQASGNYGGGHNVAFENTAFSAISRVTGFSGSDPFPYTVQHSFNPSVAAEVFQVQVTITNTSSDTLSNVTYRRAMDWDVYPTPFNEFVTIRGAQALLGAGGVLEEFSNDGFVTNDLLAVPNLSSINPGAPVNTDFVDVGPDDHGAAFDFNFGDLAPGASRVFNIYYGSAPSEAAANVALFTLGITDPLGNPLPGGMYSYGQSNGNQATGVPATFIFAFGGVGTIEPGVVPGFPLLPTIDPDNPGVFVFPTPPPRRWFDPPFATEFEYEITGGYFTQVGIDAAWTAAGVSVLVGTDPGGALVANPPGIAGDADPDWVYNFSTTDVTRFRIFGIGPLVDLDKDDDGIFDSDAFPTFLDFFSGGSAVITMRPIYDDEAIVPEPGTYLLLGAGLAALAIARRRRAA